MRKIIVGSIALLALAAAGSARADFSCRSSGETFADRHAALAAEQRELDAQAALVSVFPKPLPGRLLIVLPDRKHILQSLIDAGRPAETREFTADCDRQTHQTYARAVVRAHLVERAEIVERYDTMDPSFAGYDYVIWYQTRATAPNSGSVVSLWLMRMRGNPALMSPPVIGIPPPDRRMAETVAAMARGLLQLTGIPPASAQQSGTLPSARPPAAQVTPGLIIIRFPDDWRRVPGDKGRSLRGISPRGDVCETSIDASNERGASQGEIDRKYATIPDKVLVTLLGSFAASQRSGAVIERAGRMQLHGRQVLWSEGRGPAPDRLALYAVTVVTPQTIYSLSCKIADKGGDRKRSRDLFRTIAETFYWDGMPMAPRPKAGGSSPGAATASSALGIAAASPRTPVPTAPAKPGVRLNFDATADGFAADPATVSWFAENHRQTCVDAEDRFTSDHPERATESEVRLAQCHCRADALGADPRTARALEKYYVEHDPAPLATLLSSTTKDCSTRNQ